MAMLSHRLSIDIPKCQLGTGTTKLVRFLSLASLDSNCQLVLGAICVCERHESRSQEDWCCYHPHDAPNGSKNGHRLCHNITGSAMLHSLIIFGHNGWGSNIGRRGGPIGGSCQYFGNLEANAGQREQAFEVDHAER